MPPKSTLLSGDALIEALHNAGFDQVSINSSFNFDTQDQRVMARAHQILVDNGYVLCESIMDEGHFYRQQFINRTDGEGPLQINLRYTTNGFSAPRLALMYREGLQLVPFSRRYTHSTSTSRASELEADFISQFGTRRELIWTPVFEDSPLP